MPERDEAQPFEPRWPTLAALGFLTVWIVLLSLPMLTGAFIAGPWSDQYESGFAIRQWGAEWWKALGHVPLWNPALMGGLPWVGATHGDIFYPTAWLRLVLPIGTAMNLGFVVHYVLAGLFAYLLLRLFRVSWAGAVTGGLAYQLSGVIGSYVAPGHDGKLFVTALLPLALIALVLAFRHRRVEGYALLALAVGLGVVSPHPQMLYYMLVASGIFALYLAFGDPDAPPLRVGLAHLAAALAAVVVGMGVGMIQLFPFFEHIPLSPRAETYRGFEGATSYAIAWSHVPEFFFSGFTGASQEGTYWAGNPIKLHSEYLGLAVLALALLGALDRGRRRLVLWLGGIGLLFLLVGLGAGTPFYRLWYAVMPYMKQVRAPGMALFVVALVASVFAGFGVERLERGEGRGHARAWLAAGSVAALIALVGGIGGFARVIAEGLPSEGGRALQMVDRAQGPIRAGALVSGIALLAVGGVVEIRRRGKITALALALAVPAVVGADLWRSARPFWTYSDIRADLLAPDPIIEHLQATPGPFRVLQIPRAEVYRGNNLMAHDVLQLLGYHSTEIHRFDELMGGRNEWRYIGSPRLWDLFAVRFFITPAGIQQPSGFAPVLEGVTTGPGVVADLWERTGPARWARLVPLARKVPDDQAVLGVVNPGSIADPDRLILLPPEAPVDPPNLAEVPPPLEAAVRVESWEPGAMRLRIEPAAPQDAYVLVAENWYPDWQATVDGAEAQVLRADVSLMAVPVTQGAEIVELRFVSDEYRRGKLISLLSLAVVAVAAVAPVGVRRFRRAG